MMVPALKKMLAPSLCLLVSVALLWQQTLLNDRHLAILESLPYLLGGLSLLMALLANHIRELSTTVITLMSFWLIKTFLQAPLSTEPAGQIFQLISLVHPLLLGFLLWLPETGWRHRTGLIGLLIAPTLVLFSALLFKLSPTWFSAISIELFANSLYGLTISAIAGWLYIAVAAAGLALLLGKGSNMESSLVGCSLFGMITFGWFGVQNISMIMFSGVTLLLVLNQLGNLLLLSYRDELTQIPNRRALHKAAKALGSNYSLVMVDIDHFKKINDTHGHDLGDQVLKLVASHLRRVRSGGKVFRYGGEEFCILFRGRSADEITEDLEQLRKSIAEYDMVLRDSHSRPKRSQQGVRKRGATRRKGNIRVTVSMGLADSRQTPSGVFESVMKAADNALYGAKRNGRNRLIVA
ncbi:GGDEF domain-containing protein [Porticoccaceae bacterium LTM1]|nr:GGDEF domain-containing protein [Porticoccaceae bacterium LTM1]